MVQLMSRLRNVRQAVTAQPREVYGSLCRSRRKLSKIKLTFLLIASVAVVCLMRWQSIVSSDEVITVNRTSELRLETTETLRLETTKQPSFAKKAVERFAPMLPSDYCEALVTSNRTEQQNNVTQLAERWFYPMPQEDIILSMDDEKRCAYIKKQFHFNSAPLSEEEAQYPLAYGIVVHRWYIQVYYMLSAVYHPQNAYCISIDNGTTNEFKQAISALADCFPNVKVIVGPTVKYCENSVLDAVLSCLTSLTLSDHPWKYYQYLSGVDLPLRTNLEMVRIFKRLNGSINAEIIRTANDNLLKRITRWVWSQTGPNHTSKGNTEPTYEMPLIKSSLSATFNRESAHFYVSSTQAAALRSYMLNKKLNCPDEHFWLTLAGNPHIQMPGSFDALKLLEAVERKRELDKRRGSSNNISLNYYISRYQRWLDGFNDIVAAAPCHGQYVSLSCVFGVRDVANLLERGELIAHKLYINYQPAAFFCLFRTVKERSFHASSTFDDRPYGQLPGPRIMRQDSVEEWVNAP